MVVGISPWVGMATAAAVDEGAATSSVAAEAAASDAAESTEDAQQAPAAERGADAPATEQEADEPAAAEQAPEQESAGQDGAAPDSPEQDSPEQDSPEQDAPKASTPEAPADTTGGDNSTAPDAQKSGEEEAVDRVDETADDKADDAAAQVDCPTLPDSQFSRTWHTTPGAATWGSTVSVTVQLKNVRTIPAGCSYPISLATYETQGRSWPSSGTQVFVDHATATLSPETPEVTLTVDSPTCFGQVDLYRTATIYDGGTGAGHGPVPDRNGSKLGYLLIAGFFGGQECAQPEAAVVVEPCPVDGDRTATVTLRVTDGNGTRDFTVWAKTGDGSFVQVGGTTTLPDASGRQATVTVPLAEDTTAVIEVRSGERVLLTSDPIATDCALPAPAEPEVTVEAAPCPTDGQRTATVTVTRGAGDTRTFTVWQRAAGETEFAAVPGDTVVFDGTTGIGTATVALPEDSSITLQVEAEGFTRTFAPIDTDCDAALPVVRPDALLGDVTCVEESIGEIDVLLDNRRSETEVEFTLTVSDGDYVESENVVVPAGDVEDELYLALPSGLETAVTVRVGEEVLLDETVVVECFEEETPGAEEPPSEEAPPGAGLPTEEEPPGGVLGGRTPTIVNPGATQAGALPRTGADGLAPLAGFSLALCLLGGGIMLSTRRRRSDRHA
jgi:hypothetical protein